MIKNYIESFSEILSNTIITNGVGDEFNHSKAYNELKSSFANIRNNGGTVYLIGNGGSSGIISHSSIDFLNACKMKAVPLTDSSHLTCMANDYGYENVFKKPLETVFRNGDALIAVSSSGSSQNIVSAAEYINNSGGLLVTFSGFKSGNPLRKLGDFNFWLDSNDYGKVEIGHALLLHILSDELK